MAENSKIEWTDATFNPWWGCAEVSPGCWNCYARSFAARILPHHTTLWEPNGERRFFGKEHWSAPLRWERKARKTGKRLRVFCASMADVFDNANELPPYREMLWNLISQTPNLDWLILTKRIGNAEKMLPADWRDGYPNVWLGISVVTQAEADRDIPKLLDVPARVRFLSCEPLIELVMLDDEWLCSEYFTHTSDCDDDLCALNGDEYSCSGVVVQKPALDWVICGGESGAHPRPMEWAWAEFLRQQCADHDTAFFMKQGSRANGSDYKDFTKFPADLQVREWPEVRL